jgi:hypothetical protein
LVLLDELMPVFDVVERHRALVHASPEAVYAALREADLSSGLVTRALLSARALPAALIAVLASPQRALLERRERRARARLADFERAGFHVVAERAPEELVIGVLGKFWTLRGGICRTVTVDDFQRGPPSGYALAGWNFTIAPRSEGVAELATETRVRCAPDARIKFRAYWVVVRPGSGLIRRAMLGAIRREAERRSGTIPS